MVGPDRWSTSLMLGLLAACAPAGSRSVTGPGAEVATLSLALQHSLLAVGVPNRILVTARDGDGSILEPGSYPVEWETSDSLVANVLAGGTVIGGHVGVVEFRARSGSALARLAASVNPGPPAATSIRLSAELTRVGDRATVRGFVVDAFDNPIREIGVYCSCIQDPSVARRTGGLIGELEIVAPGQFLLSINHVDYGVPGITRVFDIRE